MSKSMEAWERKVYNRMENVVRFYAIRAYIRSNYKNGRRTKQHHSYGSAEMENALEVLKSGNLDKFKVEIMKFNFEFPQVNLDLPTKEAEVLYWEGLK